MNYIEDLLERYFEGLTSSEEESELRHFFTSGDVPPQLTMYTPLFAYLETEIQKATEDHKTENPFHRRKIRGLWISGAAACAALLAGLFFFKPASEKCPGNGNYVIINGQCYTDDETVRAAALKTLREMSDDDSDLFFENESNIGERSFEKSSGTADFIQKQLSEFHSLFDEE